MTVVRTSTGTAQTVATDGDALEKIFGAETYFMRVGNGVQEIDAGDDPDLPTLPLPTGARVAAIGDSQIAYNSLQSGSAPADGVSTNALGFMGYARGIDPRFRFESWFDAADPTGRNIAGANQGVFSDRLEQSPAGQPQLGGILGRLPAVLARKPDLLIIEGGTNTISFGVDGSAEFVISRINAAITMARRYGVLAMLMTIYPRPAWAQNDPRQAIISQVNTWIRSHAGRDGLVAVLDADPILAPGGEIDIGLYQSDLVHANARGAQRLAKDLIIPALQACISAGSIFDQNPVVTNLLATDRANMIGTTGTISGAGVTGQMATGFSLSLDRNASSILASKEVVAGVLESQVLNITPSDLNASAYGGCSIVLPAIVGPAIVAGDWVQGFLRLETSGAEGFAIARLQMAIRQSTTVRARSYGMNASSGNFSIATSANQALWIMTEPLRVPDAVTFDRIYSSLEIYWDKARPAFQVKVSRPIFRKVNDPRPGWGYQA